MTAPTPLDRAAGEPPYPAAQPGLARSPVRARPGTSQHPVAACPGKKRAATGISGPARAGTAQEGSTDERPQGTRHQPAPARAENDRGPGTATRPAAATRQHKSAAAPRRTSRPRPGGNTPRGATPALGRPAVPPVPAGAGGLPGGTGPAEPPVTGVLIARFTVPGEPVPKERARIVTGKTGKRHGYTPPRTGEAQKTIGWAFRRARPGWGLPDPDGRYRIDAVFATTVPPGSGHTQDWDNLAKLAGDALNKIVWADDSQVDAANIRVVRGAPEAFTRITIYRLVPREAGEVA